MNDNTIFIMVIAVVALVVIAILWRPKKKTPPDSHNNVTPTVHKMYAEHNYGEQLRQIKTLGNYPPPGNQIHVHREATVRKVEDDDDMPSLGAGLMLGALLSESSSSSSSGNDASFDGGGGSFAGGGASSDYGSDTSSCSIDSSTSSSDCGAN